MRLLAETAEAIAATTKKTEKVRLLAEYFRSRSLEEAAVSAVFLSGRPFPAWEETTLQVGGRLLWRVIADASGLSEQALGAAYRRHGDLGSAAYDVFTEAGVSNQRNGPNVLQTARCFREIATARGPAAKAALVRDLLARATPIEAKYLVKIITGELRIGLKESLVEAAIAAAYPARTETEPATNNKRAILIQVQRANMLLGDIGETLRLAAARKLESARMRLLHPIGFMLASPVQTSTEAFEVFRHAQVEDKYDGIRAQAHVADGNVRVFSRTLDEISESFPELIEPLAAFSDNLILDGEILAWDFGTDNVEGHSDTKGCRTLVAKGQGAIRENQHDLRGAGRALPFSALQKRLGRKRPTARIMREVPVAYVVFDVLFCGGELVIDRPLRERAEFLDSLFADARRLPARSRKQRVRVEDAQGVLQFEPAVISESQGETATATSEPRSVSALLRAPILRADSPGHLSELFERAQARGNEGLMVKDLESPYTPGRRGKSWLKLKRELATLDVVVTAVEPGHGKRAGVLSDYTFAVRDPNGTPHAGLPETSEGEPLLNIGKAYTGLTDVEIARMTEWFEQHTISDDGWVRQVDPKIVIEVAFNAVMRSDRHNSGYALRFPRILRLRPDKTPEQADTLDRLRDIYERQHALPKTA